MTLIKISLVTPLADGTTTAATGGLRFTPTARRTIAGTPDQVVLPKSFQVALVAGAADVTLAPTTAGWVWRIDEHLAGSPARTIYVTVPDVASIDYPDLVPVDPATLAPAAPLSPAWVASQNLALARDPSQIWDGVVTYTSGAPTSAAVVWPDGTTGVYTGTPSVAFPGSIDSYSITYGTTRTYTQPAVTRDASGNITNQPAIVIS
jgi:hypothetical protein